MDRPVVVRPMIDLVFFADKPAQLGAESKRMARGHAVEQLIARHQREFDELLKYIEDDMLYAALHEYTTVREIEYRRSE
jgi:hypothetical protein